MFYEQAPNANDYFKKTVRIPLYVFYTPILKRQNWVIGINRRKNRKVLSNIIAANYISATLAITIQTIWLKDRRHSA